MRRTIAVAPIVALAAGPAHAAQQPQPRDDDLEATDHDLPADLDWSQPPPETIEPNPPADVPEPPAPAESPALVPTAEPAVLVETATTTPEPTDVAANPAAAPTAEPTLATAEPAAEPIFAPANPTATPPAEPTPEPTVATPVTASPEPALAGVPTVTAPAAPAGARSAAGLDATGSRQRPPRRRGRPASGPPSRPRAARDHARARLRVRVARGATAAAVAPGAPRAREYVVRRGDALSAIATRYGTTWPALWALNRDRIADPDLIYPGQVLRVARGPG